MPPAAMVMIMVMTIIGMTAKAEAKQAQSSPERSPPLPGGERALSLGEPQASLGEKGEGDRTSPDKVAPPHPDRPADAARSDLSPPGRGSAATVAKDIPNPAAPLTPAALQKLLAWLSPGFPVGAYSYSHGLEWAIEDGSVTGPAGLEAWLDGVIRHGAGRTDAVLFVHAHKAASANDAEALRRVAELAAAFQPSKERALEATAQGAAFVAAVSAAWPNDRFTRLIATIDGPLTYPVAVAIAAAAHGIPRQPALAALLQSFLANLVSAGVRAVPIGQSDGQRIIAAFSDRIGCIAGAAETASLDDLGGAALRADIASMKHETQHTRLFRS
jgi:urease accessory protein